MPDPTDVQLDSPGQDLDVARNDPRGLKILDAVDLGGIWIVVAGNGGQPELSAAEPGGRSALRRWAVAGRLTLLVLALAVLVQVPGAAQRRASPQTPAAVAPGTSSSLEETAA